MTEKVKKRPPWIIYLVAICATIGGLLFGYDTGIINGALILLKNHYNLSTFYKETIVSSTLGAAAIFSLFAGYVADTFGRKRTIMVAAVWFALGAALMGFATALEMVIIGRIVVGCSIGFVSCIVPVYVSECAPADIRGRLITINQLFITIGILLSAIFAASLQTLDELGWRLMLGGAAIPGVIQFILFLFLPDSPRYMVMKGRFEEAERVLKKIRAEDDVREELEEIKASVEAEKDTKGCKIVKQLFTTPHVRKALFVGCMLQIFQQFCGINTVIYYSSSILIIAGFEESEAIWLTTIPFTVNFLATFIGLWAVESLGRKLVLAISFLAIAIALGVLCTGFALSVVNSPAASKSNDWAFEEDPCLTYGTCHECVHDENCGFCYVEKNDEVKLGSCTSIIYRGAGGTRLAESGRCYGRSDVQWNNTLKNGINYTTLCPSKEAWLSVLGLILFVLFFAPGAGPMPWTINAEIYPLWGRGTATSIATFCNWGSNMIVSYTFLTFLEVFTPWGTFMMFGFVCVIAAVFVMVMVPETKDKHLEEIELLFMRPAAREKALKAAEEKKMETAATDKDAYGNSPITVLKQSSGSFVAYGSAV